MTKEDIEAIEHAKIISEYCGNKARCDNNCPLFCGGCLLLDDNCRFPSDWSIPNFKTYKQEFLEKFPKANVETICRADVFGNIENCQEVHDDTTKAICAACWDEMHIE